MHARIKHKMSMKEYHENKKRQQQDIVVLVAKTYVNNARKSTTDKPSRETDESPYLPLCKFSCNLCQSEFNRWRSMRDHLTKKHVMRGRRCNALDFACHLEYYTCRECKKQILHDPELISKHIQVRRMEQSSHIKVLIEYKVVRAIPEQPLHDGQIHLSSSDNDMQRQLGT